MLDIDYLFFDEWWFLIKKRYKFLYRNEIFLTLFLCQQFKLSIDIEISRLIESNWDFFPPPGRCFIDYRAKIVVRPIIKKKLIIRHSYRILTRILSWRHAINRIQWYIVRKFFPEYLENQSQPANPIYIRKTENKKKNNSFPRHFSNSFETRQKET